MTQENKSLTTTSNSFDRFIEIALDKAVPVETLERLLAMQKDVMAINAKAQYDNALSTFQKECPIIHKGKEVRNSPAKGGGLRYMYAPMDSIISQVREPLSKNGFSYSADTEIDDKGWIVTKVTSFHIGGHSRTTTFKVPVDKDAFMNEQQKVAAARTYALRYNFVGHFGIMTGDEDDDTQSIPPDTAPDVKNQTTPQTAKPQTTPASQPPEPTPDGKLTITGLVTETTQNPTKSKSVRYGVVIAGQKYYTFDKKIAETAKETMTPEGGMVKLTYHVGQYGKDIDALEKIPSNPVPADAVYNGELDAPLRMREPGEEG